MKKLVSFKKFYFLILMGIIFLARTLFPQSVSEQIIIDQFGWRNTSKKVVIFANPIDGQNNGTTYIPGNTFWVKRASDDITVYSNTITAWKGGIKQIQSGDYVWRGEFTDFTTPGEYYIYNENTDNATYYKSYNFEIGDKIYTDILKAAVKTYYYQRCGTNVNAACGGAWNHGNCHQQDKNAQLYTNGAPRGNAKDVSGGWHDAGDYNKYIPFLAGSMWELMKAYEYNPARFGDDYNIPESGNGVPDILDEIKYELDWMLKMQFVVDGSVANRVAQDNYPQGTPPQDDSITRYYTGPTSWATATFAGILAHASRIFQNFDAQYPGYYQTLLSASTNAWNYLGTKPGMYPADGTDKACDLFSVCATSDANDDKRKKILAAAELFRTTGGAKYHTYFTNNYDDYAGTAQAGFHPLEDNFFDAIAAADLNRAFIIYAGTPGAKPDIVAEIKSALKNGLDWLQEGCYNNDEDAYMSYMWDGHYVWGSCRNKACWANILIYGIELNVATSIEEENLYREIGEEYLHYFHGRNPLSWVYLTHMTNLGGEKCAMEIYHNWFYDGTDYDGAGSLYGPAPGFLAGGPNPAYTGNVSPPKGEPIQKAYRDWNTAWPEDSWEVTEPSIDYQASYILLLSYLSTFSRITVSNFTVTPSMITNDVPRIVQFLATITTTTGNITTATLNLSNIGGGKVEMTNIVGNQWRYTYTVPAGANAGDNQVYVRGYDNLGSTGLAIKSLIIVTTSYLPTLIIYDGEGGETDFFEAWKWGQISFEDVAISPIGGSYCGRIIMTNAICGIAHLRDTSWSGINCGSAERLEFWVRAEENLAAGVRIRLCSFTTNSAKSAIVYVSSITTNWRKIDVDVSYLTTGADPDFTMEKIIGIEIYNPSFTPTNRAIYFDDIKLTARVIVSNEVASPDMIYNNVDTSVDFTCAVEGLENISTVTLDLTEVGKGKIGMTGGGGDYSHTESLGLGLPGKTYVFPIIAYDVSGNRGSGEVYLSVVAPVVAVLEIVYDGETVDTDANWDNWWGKSIFIDITNSGDVANGAKSARFEVITNINSGGAHWPLPGSWSGVDVSGADDFEFYYKGGAVDLTLFSYDPVAGTKFSTTLSLGGSPVWTKIKTNMSSLSNGEINFKKFVGIRIGALPGVVAYFDDIWFTANVVVKEEQAIPALVTNTHDNIVEFWVKARTCHLQITNVYIDLSTLGGLANAKMTNQSGYTLFRYTFTVVSNQAMGNYSLPITAYDDEGNSGKGKVNLTVTGKTPYTVGIVYDGDKIKANPEQWWPYPPPMTGFFNDVDSTVTPPHGDSYCGQYYQTNAGGTTLFHLSDSTWRGIDVSTAEKIQIWAKGESGGETVTLRFVFYNSVTGAKFSKPVGLSLGQDWAQWIIDMSDIMTNTIYSNLTRLVGMDIRDVPQNAVIYLDDIRFIKYVKVINGKADPDTVDGDKDTSVVFTCNAFTRNNNITSVTLDLEPVGGPKVLMTNISGWTSFRYTFTILSNFGLGTNPGTKECKLTGVDDQGYIDFAYIYLRIITKKMIVLWDFETGNAENWIPETSGVYNLAALSPAGECEQSDWPATNLNYMFGYHGVQCIGWDFDMSMKQWDPSAVPWDFRYGGCDSKVDYGHEGTCSINNKFDLSSDSGIIMYILVEENDTIDPEDPLHVNINVQVAGWSKFYIGPHVNLFPGEWTKVWIDFSSCWHTTVGSGPSFESYTNTILVGDLDTADELGWIVTGSYDASGMNKIYMDYVLSMDDVAPVAPDGLTVTDPGTGGTLILSWNQAGEADVERYNIYQAKVDNPNQAEFIATTTSDYYEDKAVWNGTNYYYWISAVDMSENEGNKSASASGIASGVMPTVLYPYKGATLLTTNANELPGDGLHTQLTNMAEAGVNTVGLVVRWYMSASNSDSFISNANTLPDEDIIHAINDIHAMGMKVFLKPEIVVLDGTYIADINPSNPTTWFNNYRSIITKYAAISADNGVELFSIGNELHSMTATIVRSSTNTYSADWDNVISDVRTVANYTNDLTYCALWGSTNSQVRFFDRHHSYRRLCIWNKAEIDFIGINGYYQLVDHDASAYLSKLYWAWDNFYRTYDLPGIEPDWYDPPGPDPPYWRYRYDMNFNKLLFKWFSNLKDYSASKGKDVIFTEIGYASMDYAAYQPWHEDVAAYNANENLQRNCYEAAFRRVWDQNWVEGTFWWHWDMTAPVGGNKQYTPQAKPAYNVIDMWYSIRPHHFAVKHNG